MEFSVRLFDERHPCFSWRSGSSEVEAFATLAGRQVVLFLVIVVQMLFSKAELFEFGDRGVKHAEEVISFTQSQVNINILVNDDDYPRCITEEDETINTNLFVSL